MPKESHLMLSVAAESTPVSSVPPTPPAAGTPVDERYADYRIIRRNGAVVGFAPNKIAIAVTKAYAKKYGLVSTADLKKVPHFSLGARPEFLGRLRATEEWSFVEREVDIRVTR